MKMLVCNALTGEQKIVDVPDTTPAIPDTPIDTAPPPRRTSRAP